MIECSRECAWCRGPIPATLRADALCCSVRCRQARHRFVSGVGTSVASGRGRRLRLAYADPPYPGLSRRYYGDHPDFGGEVDHGELIASLAEFDGWALSTSASALPDVLALCPRGVRVAAWHRGERPTRSAGPLNAWEPVIYFGGRLDVERDASRLTVVQDDASAAAQHDASFVDARRVADPDATDASTLVETRRVAPAGDTRSPGRHDTSRVDGRRLDSLVFHSRPRLTDPARVVGAKPAAFCRWMFDLLGAEPQDEFTDIFPGSGGVMRAWNVFAGLTDHTIGSRQDSPDTEITRTDDRV